MIVEDATVKMQEIQLEDSGSKKFARRDHLIEIEQNILNKWEEAHAFESEPDLSKTKFLVTFPYPYMNGFLHAGHLHSLTKLEFSSR
jgi:leucyl-tRNA synthetase